MRGVSLVTTMALLAPSGVWGQSPETPAGDAKPATPVGAAGPAGPARPETDASYASRLGAVERKVSDLKERVFRSKARLNLLRETVLHGSIAGARAQIVHKNEMGGSFRLVKAIYSLDGVQVFAQSDDTGQLDDKKEIEIFSGSVVPGSHTVSVQLEYRGHGYGLFPYLKGYTFSVKSSHTFSTAEGKQTVLTVVAFEKGNMTTDLKDRPAVDFKLKVGAPRVAKAGAP
jgi:hypothetical protein